MFHNTKQLLILYFIFYILYFKFSHSRSIFRKKKPKKTVKVKYCINCLILVVVRCCTKFKIFNKINNN